MKSSPFSLPASPGNHQSAFCVYGFTCSGDSMLMNSYSMWPFVSGFFQCDVFRVHIAACIDTGSFLWNIIQHYSCTPHCLFIHSSINGHLSCFHFFAVVDSVAVNVPVQAFEYKLLGHMLILFNFLWNNKVSTAAEPFYIYQQQCTRAAVSLRSWFLFLWL